MSTRVARQCWHESDGASASARTVSNAITILITKSDSNTTNYNISRAGVVAATSASVASDGCHCRDLPRPERPGRCRGGCFPGHRGHGDHEAWSPQSRPWPPSRSPRPPSRPRGARAATCHAPPRSARTAMHRRVPSHPPRPVMTGPAASCPVSCASCRAPSCPPHSATLHPVPFAARPGPSRLARRVSRSDLPRDSCSRRRTLIEAQQDSVSRSVARHA